MKTPQLNNSIEWKFLPSNQRYLISSKGQILDTKTGKFRTQYLNRGDLPNSYYFVSIKIDGKSKTQYVHRLIAETFIGECPVGYQVDHIDGNCKNNTLENVQYLTPKENMLKAKPYKPYTKFSDKDILAIRVFYKAGLSIGQISTIIKCSYTSIYRIVTYSTHNKKYLVKMEENFQTLDI